MSEHFQNPIEQIVDRGKMYTSSTHIHDLSHIYMTLTSNTQIHDAQMY
jgi:hypothetical protein